jgi:hypothetical protein
VAKEDFYSYLPFPPSYCIAILRNLVHLQENEKDLYCEFPRPYLELADPPGSENDAH